MISRLSFSLCSPPHHDIHHQLPSHQRVPDLERPALRREVSSSRSSNTSFSNFKLAFPIPRLCLEHVSAASFPPSILSHLALGKESNWYVPPTTLHPLHLLPTTTSTTTATPQNYSLPSIPNSLLDRSLQLHLNFPAASENHTATFIHQHTASLEPISPPTNLKTLQLITFPLQIFLSILQRHTYPSNQLDLLRRSTLQTSSALRLVYRSSIPESIVEFQDDYYGESTRF